MTGVMTGWGPTRRFSQASCACSTSSPDTYDLQAADCDGETLTEEYEVDLTEDLTWTLND